MRQLTQSMKAALRQAAQDEERLDGLIANYQVRKWYRQNQTGRLPKWMKPIPCLCRVKHYSQGYTSPCGKWACTQYVKLERKNQLRRSEKMTERKKNAAYWRQMKASSGSRARRYAKKYGVSLEDAKWQIQYFDMLEKDEADAIAEEMRVYLPGRSYEEE